MTYKLHRNGVITGALNSFCLACDLFLDAQEAAADHIGTSEHKKSLNAVQYSDKFQHEHIRKFKGGYYCEFCNVLMPIASKVNLHITEDDHKHNKGILLLKPMGGDVIVFNNIVIDAKAWHGLIEGVCSLCNTEFDDEKEHKADGKHSLNLVLKSIQFGADNTIFRHLDDTAVQCLTCNKLLAPGRMTKHFDETEHHDLYAKSRIETKGTSQGIEAKGTSQRIEAKGTSQRIEAKGTSQRIEAKGTSKKIEAKGTSQGIEAKGTSQRIEAKGTSQRIEAAGTSQGSEAKGTSKKIEAKGTSQGIEAKGTSQRIEAAGTSQGSEAKGTSKKIEAKGTTEGIKAKGTSQRIEAKGTSQRIEAAGTSQGSEAHENYKKKSTNMSSPTEKDSGPKKSNINNDSNKDVKSPTKDKSSRILEFIPKYQSKGININLEAEIAFCKKCSKVVTFDYMEIENHIKNHSSAEAVDSDLLYPSVLGQNLNRVDINDKTIKSSVETENNIVKALRDKAQNLDSPEENNASKEEDTDTDSSCSSDFIPPVKNFEKSSQEEEAKSFAKANKITFNGGNNQSFCRVCSVHVPASLRSLKEHVEGANHTRQAGSSVTVTKPENPRNLAKQTTLEFVDTAYEIHGAFYTASIINDEFCISMKSFHFISEIGITRRCIVCEVNLTPLVDFVEHCKTRQHAVKWAEVPFITSEKNEFIREVRPGLFHCGYCNLVVSEWSNMKQHIECSDHRENRSVWESRLRFHLPSLRRYRIEKEMEKIAMMRLYAMLHN